MSWFAVPAYELWADKILYVMLMFAALSARARAAVKRRREDAQRLVDRDVEHHTDLQRPGPPRFNG